MSSDSPLTKLSTMSGLEVLRAVLEGRIPYNGINRTLGFAAVSADEGQVLFAGTPDLGVYNPFGQVHGGYTATLLDSAMACAVHSTLKPGQSYTTLELKVAFHKPITAETGCVSAIGTVLSQGRRAAFAEGKLSDAKGRLLASATSTLIIIDS